MPAENASLARRLICLSPARTRTPRILWNPSGSLFSYFNPSQLNTGSRNLQFGGADKLVLSKPTVTYRYIKGDNTDQSVTCTVQVGGYSATVKSKLTVGKPDCMFTTKSVGKMSFDVADPRYSTPTVFGLRANPYPGAGAGIIWSYMVTLSAGFDTICGVCALAQIVTLNKTVVVGTTTYVPTLGNGTVALDGAFPYASSVALGVPEETQGDTPNVSLTTAGGTRLNNAKYNGQSFDTYVMFKAGGANATSNWIPLKKLTWSIGAEAYWFNDHLLNRYRWAIDGGVPIAPTVGSAQDATVHPTWGFVNDGSMKAQ